MNHERLEKLLDAYFDEALTDRERAELEYLLLSSPAARDLFWQRARFHALLRRYGMEYWGSRLAEQFAAEAKTTREQADRGPDWREQWRVWRGWLGPGFRWAAAAGMVLGILLTLWLWPRSGHRPLPETAPVAGVEPEGQLEPAEFEPRVAQLVRAVGVEWADPAAALLPGTVLKAGTLNLKRGWVEVEFYRGARVVIEGPAEFELISDLEARCRSGKIRVEVPPPAHGFKVLSPQLNVVDVGTSFGMEVRQGGEAEVHVFEGRVEMANPTAPHDARALERGQTVRVSATGQVQPVESAAATYVSLEEVERRFRAELRQRYRAWLESRQQVILDPALLLYYDFEELPANARLVPNLAPQAPVESHGTIIGCQRAQGRWPGKGALDFKQFGDRIRFALPGRFESLTCLAWVRVDGLSHRLNALMMAGKARTGEPQWQMEQDGRLLFGKRILDGWGVDHMENYKTAPLLTPEHMGLWMQVAVVYDGAAREVRHYLNGREVSSHPLVQPLALMLEAMEIGNWTPQVGQPIEPIRNFNGRIDEFTIYARPLTSEAIQDAYRLGQPW